ncbi:hypothetical protein HK102_011037 [Quaeritorhiza haematococci]|nr:hypothetical protein HK102_011037 [Quaeritorhiza haematococci]
MFESDLETSRAFAQSFGIELFDESFHGVNMLNEALLVPPPNESLVTSLPAPSTQNDALLPNFNADILASISDLDIQGAQLGIQTPSLTSSPYATPSAPHPVVPDFTFANTDLDSILPTMPLTTRHPVPKQILSCSTPPLQTCHSIPVNQHVTTTNVSTTVAMNAQYPQLPLKPQPKRPSSCPPLTILDAILSPQLMDTSDSTQVEVDTRPIISKSADGGFVTVIKKDGGVFKDPVETDNSLHRCTVRGCYKSYSTRAGLRYHYRKQHKGMSPPPTPAQLAAKATEMIAALGQQMLEGRRGSLGCDIYT